MCSESPRSDAECDSPAAEEETDELTRRHDDALCNAAAAAAAPPAEGGGASLRVVARFGALSGSATSAAVRPIKRMNASRSTSVDIVAVLQSMALMPQ
jgi:chaperonin GroEL (HSP60 family)